MNMYRLLLFSIITVLLTACNSKNTLKISGKITQGKDKVLYLQELTLNSTETIDSTTISGDGSFKFKLEKLKYPKFYLLKLSDKNFITLLADSTEKIEIEADAKNMDQTYSVKNSLGSQYIRILNTKFHTTKVKIDSLVNKYNKIPKEDKESQKQVTDKINVIVQDQKDFIQDFVMTNPRSFASYYAVFQRYDNGNLVLDPYVKKELNLFAAVATSMDLFYKDSPRTKQLKDFVLTIQAQLKREAMQKKLLASKDASSIPEIEEENPQGKKIKLSSLKGKLVLLSFWASWDKKSRAENQNLLKIYNKYKSRGFDVYQVSLDKSKILWEEAIENDRLPWTNVSDLQYTNSYPARIYNIKQLPANYLISRDGEIIGKDLFGRILDDKLSDLLR